MRSNEKARKWKERYQRCWPSIFPSKWDISGSWVLFGVESYCEVVTETESTDYRGSKAWVSESDLVQTKTVTYAKERGSGSNRSALEDTLELSTLKVNKKQKLFSTWKSIYNNPKFIAPFSGLSRILEPIRYTSVLPHVSFDFLHLPRYQASLLPSSMISLCFKKNHIY